jgi:hypothetical protein
MSITATNKPERIFQDANISVISKNPNADFEDDKIYESREITTPPVFEKAYLNEKSPDDVHIDE